jgi:hypothetical protein
VFGGIIIAPFDLSKYNLLGKSLFTEELLNALILIIEEELFVIVFVNVALKTVQLERLSDSDFIYDKLPYVPSIVFQ